MAYGKKWNKKKSDFNGVRVTGFFRTKTKRLYTGKIKEDNLKELRVLCKQAADQEKGVVFFLRYWADAEDDAPCFSLSAAVDQPMKKKGKDIEDTDDDPDVDDNDDDTEDEPEPGPKKTVKAGKPKPKPAAEDTDDGEDPNPF